MYSPGAVSGDLGFRNLPKTTSKVLTLTMGTFFEFGWWFFGPVFFFLENITICYFEHSSINGIFFDVGEMAFDVAASRAPSGWFDFSGYEQLFDVWPRRPQFLQRKPSPS